MNIKANQRFKANEEEIMTVFVKLLEEKDITKITVSEICRYAHLNRTTFYNHYLDVYDLLDKMAIEHTNKMMELFKDGPSDDQKENLKKIFTYMEENQLFYRVSMHTKIAERLKEGQRLVLMSSMKRVKPQNAHCQKILDYNVEFFVNGMLATIVYWLDHDCDLSIDELTNIIGENLPNVQLRPMSYYSSK